MAHIQDEQMVFENILRMIREKQFKPGEKLPSENELSALFHVPRLTVRKAYHQLESRGYVVAAQGKGRFLTEETKPIQLYLSGAESFTDKMLAAGYRLETDVFQSKEVEHMQHTNYFNGRIYNISRLRKIDDEPIAIHQSFMNMDLFPSIEEEGPFITSTFAYYRRNGFTQFNNGDSLLSIHFPSTDEQRRLDCSSVIPLIKLETSTIDSESGKVLEYTHTLYRGDKFTYKID